MPLECKCLQSKAPAQTKLSLLINLSLSELVQASIQFSFKFQLSVSSRAFNEKPSDPTESSQDRWFEIAVLKLDENYKPKVNIIMLGTPACFSKNAFQLGITNTQKNDLALKVQSCDVIKAPSELPALVYFFLECPTLLQ